MAFALQDNKRAVHLASCGFHRSAAYFVRATQLGVSSVDFQALGALDFHSTDKGESMKTKILALMGFVLTGCATPATNLNKLSVGMTKQEVVSAMGQPTRTSATQGVEYMIYHDPNNGFAAAGTFGAIPYRRDADYYVRLNRGKVDAFGALGDFDSTHVPEQKIDIDWNGRGGHAGNESRSQSADFDQAFQSGIDAFEKRKDYNACVTELKRAVAIRPDDAKAWCALGVCYGSLQQYSEMLIAFTRAEEIAPNEPTPLAGVAGAYYKLGEMDKYNEALEKLRLSHPKIADLVDSSLKEEAAKGK